MKRPILLLVIIALGLVLGGWAIWSARSGDSQNPGEETKQTSGRPSEKRSGSDRPPGPKIRPQPLEPHAPGLEPGSPEDFAAMITQDLEKKQGEARMATIHDRLQFLKSRLGLSDEQAAEVQAILEKEGSIEAGVQPASLAQTPDLEAYKAANEAAAKADERIIALLQPEQQEEYAAFRREQHEQRAEASLTRDMNRLQQTAKPSPDQEARIREAFWKLSWEEEKQAPAFGPKIEAIRAKREARLGVLRDVLTLEQLEAYQGKAKK